MALANRSLTNLTQFIQLKSSQHNSRDPMQVTQLNVETLIRKVQEARRGNKQEPNKTELNTTQYNSIQLPLLKPNAMQCFRTLIRIDQETPGGSKQEELDLSKTIQVHPVRMCTLTFHIAQGFTTTTNNYSEFISRVQRSPICFWTRAATTCLSGLPLSRPFITTTITITITITITSPSPSPSSSSPSSVSIYLLLCAISSLQQHVFLLPASDAIFVQIGKTTSFAFIHCKQKFLWFMIQ